MGTFKEVIRHFAHLLNLRRKPDFLSKTSLEERFSAIYSEGVWQNDGGPMSGAGSSLEVTRTVAAQLPDLLDSLGVKTLLDVGCGDFTWMRNVALNQDYIGVDVVPSVIDDNQIKFAGNKRSFALLDATNDDLPAADALLFREILFHLSFEDIRAMLKNCLRGERAYVIATTDRSTSFNADILSGDFRRLNLERRPLSLPAPVTEVADDLLEPQRVLGVWRVEDVLSSLR